MTPITIISDAPNCGVTYDRHYDDCNSFIIQATGSILFISHSQATKHSASYHYPSKAPIIKKWAVLYLFCKYQPCSSTEGIAIESLSWVGIQQHFLRIYSYYHSWTGALQKWSKHIKLKLIGVHSLYWTIWQFLLLNSFVAKSYIIYVQFCNLIFTYLYIYILGGGLAPANQIARF